MRQVRKPLPALLIATACVMAAFATAPASAQSRAEQALWLEKLDRADRMPLRGIISYAPPAFSDDLQWHNINKPLDWEDLRNKVVVIQSWTSASEHGRIAATRVIDALKPYADDDVQLILLHTPDNAAKAGECIARRELKKVTIVDPRGEFCDDLGVYRRPVNIVIDRQGAVRYAGLTEKGLSEAINMLLVEEYNPEQKPKQRVTNSGTKQFPVFSGSVGRARDIRGQHAPDLHVQEWLNHEPETEGKIVVVAFWATWCGPCLRTIPRLNEITEKFGDDVAIVGVSSEQGEQIRSGMARRNLKPETFKYSIGYDGAGTMSRAVDVNAIPHSIVMCKDGIVRWQGHPGNLTDDVLQQLIDINKGQTKQRGRWMSSRQRQ